MTGVGDNVVDLYADLSMQYPGGGAANVAVQASRLGWNAHYVGIIGSDPAGDFIAEALESEDVDIAGAIRSDEPNPVTRVRIDERGNREFSGWEPPRHRLELNEEALHALHASRWVYSNYSGLAEHLLPELASIAPLVFDFSYKERSYAAPILPHVTAAAYSRESLSEAEIVDLIRWTQDLGPSIVVVTRGAAGAIVAVDEQIHLQAAVPVRVVDTLGAGDAFLARLLCELAVGTAVPAAAALASETAARTCTESGAFGHGTHIVTS